jgi:hypothetical protein
MLLVERDEGLEHLDAEVAAADGALGGGEGEVKERIWV